MHYCEIMFMDKYERVRTEINVQNEVLKELALESPDQVFRVVEICAALFRKIIDEFEKSHNRPPTKDELIWVCSEKLKRNIRNFNNEI
jgi:hypothetical protein